MYKIDLRHKSCRQTDVKANVPAAAILHNDMKKNQYCSPSTRQIPSLIVCCLFQRFQMICITAADGCQVEGIRQTIRSNPQQTHTYKMTQHATQTQINHQKSEKILEFKAAMRGNIQHTHSCVRWGGLHRDSTVGRSCCSGQWSNPISSEQLKVMGLLVRSPNRPA